MSRLVPLFVLALAVPAVPSTGRAAPKKPTSRNRTKKAAPRVRPASRKAFPKPCSTLTYTPPPIIVDSLYTLRDTSTDISAVNTLVHVKLQGRGLLLGLTMSQSRPLKRPGFEAFSTRRLDALPIPERCQISDGQSGWSRFNHAGTDDVEVSGNKQVIENVSCGPSTAPCEVTFKPITIELEPRAKGCQYSSAHIQGPSLTVVAKPAGVAPRLAEPSIDVGLETRNESSGVVYRGVLTAVPPQPPSKRFAKRATVPMYRGTFRLDHAINTDFVRTMYPGCALATDASFADDTLSVEPTTGEPEVVMSKFIQPSEGLFHSARCSWRGTGPDRVLACHIGTGLKNVRLADELH